MASIFDTAPYPWDLREARELHMILTELFPGGDLARFVATAAGIKAGTVNWNQAAYLVWYEVLNKAANSRKTRAVVESAKEQEPDSPRAPFLEALLQEQPVVHDAEPRKSDGASALMSGSDAVTVQEALLFMDDLTLPVGRVPWLIRTLEMLKTIAPSVCRLEAQKDGVTQRGTGFRIASDLLLTNWHVLHVNGQAATKVVAEFGYEDDGAGGGLASTAVACDVATMKADQANDWGVIKTTDAMADSVPILKLSEAQDAVVSAPAFIIQHPGGERKVVGFVRNTITAVTDRVVQYLTDTQTGSSGSPVLNDAGRLVALHHAGGRPQLITGKPPLAKNEGIRISVVATGLAAAGIAVP